MNNVVRHIEYLLLSNDCVIIPGLGAVLAQTLPAHYDAREGLFYPPVREFSFNGALTRGDGLLVSSVARARSVAYEAASRLVDEEVEAMRIQLATEGRLSLGRVGELEAGRDGSMFFNPGVVPALDPAYSWLQPLAVAPVTLHKTAVAAAASGSHQRSESRPRPWLRKVSYMAKIAASVAALAAVGFVLSTPVKVEDAQLASLGIEQFSSITRTAEPAAPSLIERPGTSSSALVLVLSAHPDAATQVDTAAYNRNRLAPAQTARKTEGKYCYVIASLGSRSEAERYIERNGAEGYGILDKDGRFRVYAFSGDTSADVLAVAREEGLDARYPGAWVCRR